ncbi:MAG: hypothetical protein AB7O97_13770 [Planctomycetota bacterium]
MQILRTLGAVAVLAGLSLAQVIPIGPQPVPPIRPNNGIVGGQDQNGLYQLYLVPNLGTPAPGAPQTMTGLSAGLASRMVRFVIDQANADIIAAASPTGGSGEIEIWRVKVFNTSVVSETLLTTLPGTAGMIARAMHRDASGCILVLCRPNTIGGTFTVHRVAVTRQGALASQIPIGNPAADMIDAIATDPAGQIVLGGRRAPYSSASPGVTLSVSQAGGTPTVSSVVPGFHVIAAETDSIGTPALGLSPQSLPPQADFSCGGAQFNFQFNSPPFTTLFNDIERTPSGNLFVLAGVGFFAAGGPGGLIQVGASGCVPGAPMNLMVFQHGINQVAIAFASTAYGCGCPPSTDVLPQIGEFTPPTIGQPWQVVLTNGVPNSQAILISGRTDKNFQGLPLPQPLSIVGGQPQCFLLNSAVFQFGPLNTNPAGTAIHSLTIPNDPTLIGSRLFSEWLVFETTPGVPFFSTAGLASTIR